MSDVLGSNADSEAPRFLHVWEAQSTPSAFRPSAFGTVADGYSLIGDDEDDDDIDLPGIQVQAHAGPTIEQQLADAYQQGLDDGRRMAMDSLAEDEAAKLRLAEAVEQLRPQLSDTICLTIMRTVKALLENSSGFAEPDQAMLTRHCETLVQLVGKDMNAATLHLHPADLALMGDAEFGVPVVADDTLRRGTICLGHADGWVEQGTQPMLDELQSLIEEVEANR